MSAEGRKAGISNLKFLVVVYEHNFEIKLSKKRGGHSIF